MEPQMMDEPHPARNTANMTEPAATTWPGAPLIPDRGNNSLSAGASTSAKMKESMPSSVQPHHAAQKPRTCAPVNGSRTMARAARACSLAIARITLRQLTAADAIIAVVCAMSRRPAKTAHRIADDPSLSLCRRHAVALIHGNLTPAGVLAARPGPRARRFGYTAIFGRDAAICALGMALSGDTRLRREAARGLVTLASYQAPNGQMPKFVDVQQRQADFWYLGCIDSTLWWLIAVALLDAWGAAPGLRQRYTAAIEHSLQWLRAQEHQRFFLLQQNEASDWADIMPRSGFVLYTNALWFYVKRLYDLSDASVTRASCNALLHPFSAQASTYRRAHLLADYVLRGATRRRLYLSFVNFSFFGDEGDV